MAVPSKADQVAEAAARNEAGGVIDPAATLNVVDDGPRGDPGATRPALTPADEGGSPQLPPAKSPFDDRRAEIVARFRTNRNEEVEDQADEISDFTRSGMPPEFAEPNAPVIPEQDEPIEPEPAAAAPAEPAAPVKFKVKVRGQEMELTQEELIAKAQIALGADNYLDEAKSKLNEVDNLLRQTRSNTAPRTGQDGTHPAAPHSAQPAEPGQTDPADPQHPEDELQKLVETLQFGDPTEARERLGNTLSEMSKQAVTTALQTQRLQDEGARTSKVLEDFKGQHPDLANDPLASAAIERKMYDLQVEDLKALNVDLARLPTQNGNLTPADISLAHRWYRANGYQVRKPEDLLETATSQFLTWKGVVAPKPNEPAADSTRTAPRIDVTVDRTARRQAIPQQPSRTVAPKLNATPAPAQPRDRSAIVEQMKARTKGSPRRGGAAVPA